MRVSDEEHARIERIAKQRNLTVSQLVRKIALNPDGVHAIEIDIRPIAETRTLLKRVSNNANQLAYESHRMRNVNDLEYDIRLCMDDLARTVQSIDTFLSEVNKSL